MLNQVVTPESQTEIRVRALLALDPGKPETIDTIVEAYPEITHLHSKVNPVAQTPEAVAKGDDVEFKRCIGSLLCLRHLLEVDYERFSEPQGASPLRVSRRSFYQLAGLVSRFGRPAGRIDNENVDTLVTYIVLSDLGKSGEVRKKAEEILGNTDFDHDRLLDEIIAHAHEEEIAGFLPSFIRLPRHRRTMIVTAASCSLNLGHLLQGETVPGVLTPFSSLSRDVALLELCADICDIAGARSHEDNTGGSIVVNQPKCMDLLKLAGLLIDTTRLDLSHNPLTPDQAFKAFLRAKGEQYRFNGGSDELFQTLTKCALLARCEERRRDPDNVIRAWETLDENEKEILISEMNRSGIDGDTAIIPTYLPVIIRDQVASKGEPGGMKAALEALARYYEAVREKIERNPGLTGKSIVLVDMHEFARKLGEDPSRIEAPFEVVLPSAPGGSFRLSC